MIGGRLVELGQRGQALLGKLSRVPPSHGRDESTCRHALRPRFEHRLDLGHRSCALERCVIPGPNTEKHDVVVVVDQPGTTVRPRRLISRVHGLSRWFPALPTDTNRPS